MGTFKLPIFQYIINEDFQATLKADKAGTISDYAAGTNLSPADATHLFRMEGEIDWFKCTQLQLLQSAVRVRKEVWATAVKQVSTFVVSSVTASAGDVFRIVTDSLDKTPTAYQNIPNEKRYQISKNVADAVPVAQVTTVTVTGTNGNLVLTYDGTDYSEAFDTNVETTIDNWDATHTAAMAALGITVTNTATTLVFTSTIAGEPHETFTDTNSTGDMAGAVVATTANVSGGEQIIADNIVAVINADDNASVVATSSNTTVTLTAKNYNESFAMYSTAVSGTFATGTSATPWVNDYENLKNYQWVADLEFDRNVEQFPQKGAKYNSYYFRVDWTQTTGGHSVAGLKESTGESVFMVYVKQGLSLDTALDAFATDMNV